VLIDAPAALSSLTFDAIGIAKQVLVVAEPSLFSLKSASEAVEFALSAPQIADSSLRSVKVLLNKVDGSAESTFRIKELRSMYPKLVVKSQMSLSDAIVESNSEGIPVQVIRGVEASLAATEFDALLSELLGTK
jgi:cellulose biosynthesis protein BcsQ